MKNKRVVVAMSGGVDSSVAAALLRERGYEVIGMTMCFNLADSSGKRPACCGIQGIEDARRVCHKLGIRHYVVNMQKQLEEYVIKDFISEYFSGRTPNPCVRCNQFLKFDILLKKALTLDADFLATGHYARIAHSPKPKARSYLLKKAKDLHKDQSYFLYRLSQSQLKHILFPLGNYTKQEVRELARKFKLSVAEKAGSQEICFVPNDDYRPFLKSYIEKGVKPGAIVDNQGKILGRHRGIAYYTIGQREGLGIALGYPAYITEINQKKNQIRVGKKEEAFKSGLVIKDFHLIGRPIKKKVAVGLRIRYNHQEARAEVKPQGKNLMVLFKEPQFAVTPGQSAVFYNKNILLGGGIIEKGLD